MPVILPRLPRPKTRAGKLGMVAGGILAGLVALDLIALAGLGILAASAGIR